MVAAASNVKVVVSEDHLKAWVRLSAEADPGKVTRDQLLSAMEAARVAPLPQVQARLDDLLGRLQAGSLPDGDFLLAEGTLPTEPVDAAFEWDPALRPRSRAEVPDDARVNHYDRNTIICAAAGAVIGRLSPPQAGRAGMDVHGNSLSPARRPRRIILRGNVDVGADGTVIAKCDGRVVFEDGRLSVAPILEIPGDVDFGTGNIDSPGDVIIRGSVKDLFHVRSSRDITVDGHVDGSVLEGGGTVAVRGGIHGHGKAVIRAAGRLETRICDGAAIEVGDVLCVQRECINCHVHAGRISSPAGTIIGGYTWARSGIEVQNLGSPAAVKTVVSVGIPVHVIEEASRMVSQAKECLDEARRIRQEVAPLIREIRRLSPEQRKRAAEMVSRVDALERQARSLDDRRQKMILQARPDAEPVVLVAGRVYAGVTVIVSGRCTTIESALRGPLRILERKIDGVTTLVAVDSISGSARPLPTARFTAEAEKQAIQACDPSACAPAGA